MVWPMIHDNTYFGLRYSSSECVSDALKQILKTDPQKLESFEYIVTPNADHLVRVNESASLRDIYNCAWMCFNDSRLIQLLFRLGGVHLPLVRGSDLIEELLRSEWISGKRLIVIGGDDRLRPWLNALQGPKDIIHYNPPMNYIQSPIEVQKVQEIIRSGLPGVIVFSTGSPNQEIVAHKCKIDGLKGGIAFCSGAAILMAAGIEKRAPILFRKSVV